MSKQPLFPLDFSQYNGSQISATKVTFAKRFPIVVTLLAKKLNLPGMDEMIRGRVDRGLSKHFIRYEKTTSIDGEAFLQRYENWTVSTILNASGVKGQEATALYERMLRQPVGLLDPPNDDTRCYTAQNIVQVTPTPTTGATPRLSTLRSAASAGASAASGASTAAAAATTVTSSIQYLPTTFLSKLQFYQKETYIALRNNLNRYMDDNAKRSYDIRIKSQDRARADNDADLKDDNFFDVDKRYKWHDIKQFVINVLCRLPLKGDSVVIFRTTLRPDSSTILDWTTAIADLKDAADGLGNAYGVVADSEAKAAAFRWVTKVEEELLQRVTTVKGTANQYPNLSVMNRLMDLKTFCEYVASIDISKLPKNFKQAKSREALSQSLFTYETMQKYIARATKELRERISYLDGQLQLANRKIKHMGKTQIATNRQMKEVGLRTPVQISQVAVEESFPFGKKTKDMYCQLCWNLGLKKRKHLESECKPALREKALKFRAEKQRKHAERNKKTKDKGEHKVSETPSEKSTSQGNKQQGNSKRKYPLEQYEKWMCPYCKAEDVNPKACKHKKETCFRRPDGPLKGITDPKERAVESRKLAAKLREKRNGKNVVATGFVASVVKPTKPSVSERLPEGTQLKETWSREDVERMGQSKPNNYFQAYLLNETYSKNPLTQAEVDMILPDDVSHSPYLEACAHKYYGRVENERQMYKFRRDPKKSIRSFRSEYKKHITGERQRYGLIAPDKLTPIETLRQRGAPAPVPAPKPEAEQSLHNNGPLPEKRTPDEYVTSSPSYVPKKKIKITVPTKRKNADRDMAAYFEGGCSDEVMTDEGSFDDDHPVTNPTSYVSGVDPTHLNKRRKKQLHNKKKRKKRGKGTEPSKKTKRSKVHDRRRATKVNPIKVYMGSNKGPEIDTTVIYEDPGSPLYKPEKTKEDMIDEDVDTLKPARTRAGVQKLVNTLEKYLDIFREKGSDRDFYRIKGLLDGTFPVNKFPKSQLNRLKMDLERRTRHYNNDGGEYYIPTSCEDDSDDEDTLPRVVGAGVTRAAHTASPVVSDISDNPDATESDSDSQDTLREKVTTNCCTTTRSNTNIPPAVVASQSARPKIKIERIRWGALKDELEDVKSIPEGLWCPATSKSKPLGMNIAVTNVIKTDRTNSNAKLISETPGTRLLQTYMNIKTPSGRIIKGRVQLDTQANVNYVLAQHALPRARRPWEATHAIGIGNNLIKLGVPNQLTVMKDGKPIAIDTVRANPQMFRYGCVALLGADAIHTLGIDIHYHLDRDEHVDVKFREDSMDNEVCIRAEEQALERYPTYQQLERQIIKKTYLSESVCSRYLEKKPNEYQEDQIPLESIDICPNVPPEIKAMILSLLRKYEVVFSKKTNELPRPLKHVGPHKFKLKPGAVPTRVGRPSFGPSQTKIINDWLEWALNCTSIIDGKEVSTPLVEPATTTSWSSRLVLAPKYKNTTVKGSVPDGIRVTWAGTGANEMIQKTVPTYPDAWQQLYKVANFKYKFSADGLKQYWSIPLEEGSRDVTAFWTPKGLFRFTRLVMGTKNAATVAQNAYTLALNAYLHEQSQKHIANFADDFIGGADTYESLLFHFEQFLKMCKDTQITLNPAKVRLGYECERWYGLTVDKGKISPTDRNLDPVKRMVAPRNKSELRSILGVFNQFSNFIPDYMKEGSPAKTMNSLMPKNVEFKWTDLHEKALQKLKKIVLEGNICLHAPDHNYKLILETDASNDGWGAVLYQMINGEKRIIKMWSKAWKTEAWKKKPTYHREAKAWMNGLTLTIPYALCNKYPVECWTDHTPLTWIKHTSGKGPVSQFIIDKLSIVDYEMHYIKGKDNVPADTLSRFPLLGPNKLEETGTRNALDIVMAALVGTRVDLSKLWVYVGKDTKFLIDDIQEWRHGINKAAQRTAAAREQCYMDLLSTSNIRRLKYTLGIWAPDADKVTEQCYTAFEKDTPFACLVPNDLVGYIARDSQGQLNESIAKKVEAAFKITLLAPGMTWIIHGVDFSKVNPPVKTVHQNERVTPQFDLQQLCRTLQEASMTPSIPQARTRADWIREQKRHRIKPLWTGTEGVYEAQDGLLVFEEEKGAPLKTIVPPALQIPLVERQHKAMCHVGSQKVFTVLKRSFHWKNMRRTCRHVNDACALCNLLKAKMKHAHKHFRPKLFCTPRTAYGADYYGVGKKSSKGYNNILGIIDLATGHLVLRALKQRTAANTAHTVFYDVIAKKGVPLLFHSDAAKEFVSTAMDSLSKTLGIVQTNTLAHNPKSNAKIERVWEFVGRCLRAMNTQQYAEFHKYVPIMAHVWNTVPDSETGVTPFQAEHGMPCRSIAESILQQPPAEGLPATADDLKSIAVSVNAFIEHISNVKAVEKAQAAIRLNANGTSRIQYNVGDKVGFYLPPSDEAAKAMGKKKKHMLQFVGPGEIVQVLSPNNTAFRIRYQGRHYERNVMHLSKYKSADIVPGDLQIAVDNEVTVGSFIAVLDDDSDTHYHVAKVIDITDEHTKLHYYGTKGRKLRGAKWVSLFHHPGTNEVIQHEPNHAYVRNWAMYTGTIDTRARDDSLVVLANLGLNPSMRLNAATKRLLERTKYKHHVIGRTWLR